MDALAIALIAVFLSLVLHVFMRAKHLIPLILVALLYNYTLHGYVLVFLHDKFNILEESYYSGSAPYFAVVNENYYAAVVTSLLFASIYLLVAAIISPHNDLSVKQGQRIISVNGWSLLLGGSLAFAIGIWPWVEAITVFLNEGTSAYLLFKGGADLGPVYPISRTMLSFAAMCLFLILLAKAGISPGFKLASCALPSLHLSLVMIVCVLFFLAMLAFGNRVTLVEGVLAALIVVSFRGVRRLRMVSLTVVVLIPIVIIGAMRDLKDPNGTIDVVRGAIVQVIVNAEASTGLSQYVAFSDAMDPYPDGSLSYLVEVMVPRFVADDRPEYGPYEHFAQSMGFPDRQGWGMHFLTDCYVNYGLYAIIVGAAALGVFHWGLYGYACNNLRGQFMFAGVMAAYPLSIRSGIAGLKGYLIMGTLGLLLFAVSRARKSSNLSGLYQQADPHRL